MKKNQWIVAAVLSGAMLTPAAFARDRTERASNVGTKVGTVVFRLASQTADSGFEAQTLPNGRTVYVSAQDAFTSAEVGSIATTRSGDGQQMSITLEPGASERLAMRTTESGADSVAIIRGGRVVAVGSIASIGVNITTITGLTAAEAARIQRLVATRNLADASTVVTVVPQQAVVSPGGMVTVDVYISNVQSLRTYQFALSVTNGDTGSLTRDHGVVDLANADFVFDGRGQVIQAVDEVNGRFGAVLFQGGADAPTRKYLGSYTYQVSPDASGTFTISVTPGTISFLISEAGVQMPYRTLPAKVTIN